MFIQESIADLPESVDWRDEGVVTMVSFPHATPSSQSVIRRLPFCHATLCLGEEPGRMRLLLGLRRLLCDGLLCQDQQHVGPPDCHHLRPGPTTWWS